MVTGRQAVSVAQRYSIGRWILLEDFVEMRAEISVTAPGGLRLPSRAGMMVLFPQSSELGAERTSHTSGGLHLEFGLPWIG
jgi:hypothetical protein